MQSKQKKEKQRLTLKPQLDTFILQSWLEKGYFIIQSLC